MHEISLKPDSTSRKKESHAARQLRVARAVYRRPRSGVKFARSWFVRLWVTKGGGFYGLGYVIAFVMLEFRTFTGDLGGGGGVAGFITSQVFQYLIRISFESILNVFLAAVWPIYLLGWLGVWGFAVLIGGYLLFELAARPAVEAWFPELNEAGAAEAGEQEAGEQE